MSENIFLIRGGSGRDVDALGNQDAWRGQPPGAVGAAAVPAPRTPKPLGLHTRCHAVAATVWGSSSMGDSRSPAARPRSDCRGSQPPCCGDSRAGT